MQAQKLWTKVVWKAGTILNKLNGRHIERPSREVSVSETRVVLHAHGADRRFRMTERQSELFNTAMAKLNHRQMIVINLTFYQGLSTRQIAKETGKSREWVRTELEKAVNTLSRHLNGFYDEPEGEKV